MLQLHNRRLFKSLSEAEISHAIQGEQLKQVQDWIQTHSTDSDERLAIRLLFEENCSPQQIVARYPQHFPTVHDVYRIQERLLKRAIHELNMK